MNLPPLSPGFELGIPEFASYTQSGMWKWILFQLAGACLVAERHGASSGGFAAALSAASSFHVYPLREQEAKAGTLKAEKYTQERPAIPGRQAEL
jgi:hypothetical protein